MSTQTKHFAYSTTIRWDEQKKGTLSAKDKDNIAVATPPEFKGHAGIWSPEDLFVASANACLMSTFLNQIERAGIVLHSYEAVAQGTLEFQDKAWRFTKISITPQIVVTEQDMVSKALEVLRQAEATCLVANSMRTEVVVGSPEIRALSEWWVVRDSNSGPTD